MFLLNSIIMSTWRLTTLKKKYSCVAKNKSFGIAGTRSFQGSHLPFFLSLPWASEPLWDSDRWEASARWPFLNSARSLQVSVIFILRGEAHGDPNLLGQEQKLRNCEWLRVWVRDECENLPWETATHGNTFPLNTYWNWGCCYQLNYVPPKSICWCPES